MLVGVGGTLAAHISTVRKSRYILILAIDDEYNVYLVPSTAERMLEKSLTTPSDVIIYDLEDSVPPSPADKTSARARLAHFLSVHYIFHLRKTGMLLMFATPSRIAPVPFRLQNGLQ